MYANKLKDIGIICTASHERLENEHSNMASKIKQNKHTECANSFNQDFAARK